MWKMKSYLLIFKSLVSNFVFVCSKKSILPVLKNGFEVIDNQNKQEIIQFLQSRQCANGGFANRAGQPDLYYSMFGCLLAEALGLKEALSSLRMYTENEVSGHELSGVDLFSAAVLVSRLCKNRKIKREWKLKVRHQMKMERGDSPDTYRYFMGMLALYYLGDYGYIIKTIANLGLFAGEKALPSTVLSAKIILLKLKAEPVKPAMEELMAYYREPGGFTALLKSPQADLLSTAVVLFALRFANADMAIIKYDSMVFVNNLYADGSFCSSPGDPETDVEYLFYGLMALGAMV